MVEHTFSLMAFLITGFFCLVAVIDLARGRRDIILCVYPAHFLLCGIPLLLDWIMGKPDYDMFPGLVAASNHHATHLVYCLYVATCPLLWWFWNRRFNTRDWGQRPVQMSSANRPWLTVQLLLVAFLPFILVSLAPDAQMYLSYTPYQRGLRESYDARMFHMLISRCTLFSVVAIMAVLSYTRRWKSALPLLLSMVAGLCWLHGKRNIVAFSVIMFLFVVWYRRLLRVRQFIVLAVVMILAFGAYSYIYQTHWRYSSTFVDARHSRHWYENYRIDYGRDDVIKMAILGEFNPKSYRVLDYRGQSVEIVLTIWIPRFLWPDKPKKYPSYITEISRGGPSPGGGALTTSWLDEAISNFSWLAFFIAPWWIHIIARIGNSCRSFSVSLLTVLILIFMQTAHFAPWAPLWLVWMALVFWSKFGAPTAFARFSRRVRTPSQES